MFRIKICGITNVDDAVAAVDAGTDAIGINFYEKSPRFVKLDDAKRIVDATEQSKWGVVPIGVFVNHSPDDVRHIWSEARLDAVQLHGDEPPEFLAKLNPIPMIRVYRFDDRGVAAIAQDLAACRAQAITTLLSVLIDALSPGRYGGSGETVSWVGIADHKRWLNIPLILAGGLTPDNVAEAIRIVRPHAVDVASGVESAPGKKDPVKMRDFIAAARAAFAS